MGIFDFFKKKKLEKEEIPFYKKIKINLQDKASAQSGTIEKYFFENEHIGLQKTLFHKIYIPLTPFDSGLEYESQPVETALLIDFLNLSLYNTDELDGITIKSMTDSQVDTSVYIGNAHNPFDILEMTFHKIDDDIFNVTGNIMIQFEHEMVACNESFNFETTLKV